MGIVSQKSRLICGDIYRLKKATITEALQKQKKEKKDLQVADDQAQDKVDKELTSRWFNLPGKELSEADKEEEVDKDSSAELLLTQAKMHVEEATGALTELTTKDSYEQSMPRQLMRTTVDSLTKLEKLAKQTRVLLESQLAPPASDDDTESQTSHDGTFTPPPRHTIAGGIPIIDDLTTQEFGNAEDQKLPQTPNVRRGVDVEDNLVDVIERFEMEMVPIRDNKTPTIDRSTFQV